MIKTYFILTFFLSILLIFTGCKSPSDESSGSSGGSNGSTTSGTSSYSVTYTGNVPTLATTDSISVSGLPSAVSVTSGSKTTQPTSPTLSGWDFIGWYTDAAGTSSFSFDTAITANTTLYAKWNTQLEAFDSTVTEGSININVATAVVTPSNLKAIVADPNVTGNSGLMVINSASNSIPTLQVTLPAFSAGATKFVKLSYDIFPVGDSITSTGQLFFSGTPLSATYSSNTSEGNWLTGVNTVPNWQTKLLGTWLTVVDDSATNNSITDLENLAQSTTLYLGLGIITGADAVYLISNVTITDNGTTPKTTVLADFNSVSPTAIGSIGTGEKAQVVDLSKFSGITTSSQGGKVLLVMAQGTHAIPTFSAALPKGDSLGNYKTLTYQVFGVTTSSQPSQFYAITSPTALSTYSTTLGTNNLIGYVSSNSVASLGSWSAVTFDLTQSAITSLIKSGGSASGASLNLGLGLDTSAGAVYLIDGVEVVN